MGFLLEIQRPLLSKHEMGHAEALNFRCRVVGTVTGPQTQGFLWSIFLKQNFGVKIESGNNHEIIQPYLNSKIVIFIAAL